MKFINEEDTGYVMSPEEAQEVARITLDHNKKVAQKQKEIQDLDNILVVAKSNIRKKYAAIEAQKSKLQAAKKTANAPTTTAAKTGYVDKAGNATDAQGNIVTQESYNNILKVKQIINEETFDTRYADSKDVQDLKDYMDAENIPYIEDEDETTIDFDKSELDPEWEGELEDIGLEEIDNDVDTEDILDIKDDEEEDINSDEKTSEEELDVNDNEDVFYVKIKDSEGDFVGKVYKLFDEGDWRAKVIKGDSKTFEKLNYEPDFDVFDIIAFLRENYDDAEVINKEEFNDYVESDEEPAEEIEETLDGNGNMLTIQEQEIKESHKIQTFNQFLNEVS